MKYDNLIKHLVEAGRYDDAEKVLAGMLSRQEREHYTEHVTKILKKHVDKGALKNLVPALIELVYTGDDTGISKILKPHVTGNLPKLVKELLDDD